MAYNTQKEREWLAKKLNSATATPQTTLEELRRRYYMQVTGSTPQTSFTDLEIQWLLKEIANRGGTPSGGAYPSQLWIQLVAVIGGTPSKYINQNRLIFFSTAS